MNRIHQSSLKTCAGCRQQIEGEGFISCNSGGCTKSFHNQCINIKKDTPELRGSWICPDCCSVLKKGGDNSLTPVRGHPTTDNVTVRKHQAKSSLSTVTSESLMELTSEIRMLREDVSLIKSKLENAVTTIERYESRLDDLAASFCSLEQRLVVVEERAAEVPLLKNKISELQEQLNTQAQQSLRNEIEIIGIPEHPHENPHHLLLTTAIKVGIKLQDVDVDYITRVGLRNHEQTGTGKSRPIVVRFTRRTIRDNFLKAAKSRHLNTKDIELDGPVQNVFINERLTRDNRFLFRECRKRASQACFKFCWSRGGSILVRKREGRGKGSEAVVIKTQGDMDRVFGSDNSSTSA